MPWAGNIAKAMTSNGKQFTVTWSTVHCWLLLHVMAGISEQFSNFAFVLFCYITNHLMTGLEGNSEYCFPRISMFPSTSSRKTLRFSGNKIHCSPRDQSLSVYDVLVIALSICEEAVRYVTLNSLHLQITDVFPTSTHNNRKWETNWVSPINFKVFNS